MTLPVPAGSFGLAQAGMFIALCRWVNWPPTIQALINAELWPTQRPDWRAMGDLIDQRTASGVKAWTGAYMVRGEQKSHGHAWAHWGKGRYVAEIVVKREMLDKANELRAALRENTRWAVHKVLADCYGWGPFMAGQVADDWTWTSLLRDPKDDYTWAPQGPGSIRGLNRLKERPIGKAWEEEEYLVTLREVRHQVIQELGEPFADLTLHDLSNVMCEFDKYERVRLGEGRPRSLYKPETRF